MSTGFFCIRIYTDHEIYYYKMMFQMPYNVLV